MRRWITLSVAAGLVVVGCSTDGVAPSSTTATTSTAPTTTTLPSDEICRIGDLRFGDEGLVAALGEDVGDAHTISQIRWEDSATCERITVAFASESGAPASSLGPTGVTVIPFAGIVRVNLPPELDTTAIADLLSDGEFAQRVFVIRDTDGALSIDIHAMPDRSVAARAFTTGSPSTLVIDLIDAEAQVDPAGVRISPVAAVVSPSPGDSAYPLSIEGYAAPGLGTLRLQVSTGRDVWTDRTLALAAWPDAWQSFATVVSEGRSGMATIFVGTVGPEGQPDEGVEVVVDMP
jgi:hypothetical protein